jgi:hypothetical protein
MPAIIFLVIPIIIAGIVYSFIAAKKRREELTALANKLGFSFDQNKDRRMDDNYKYLNTLRLGSNRYAYNIMSGSYQGYPMQVFDYHYQTGSGKNTHHHYFSFFIMTIEISCPELTITKEHVFSKIGQALGFDDIDFESHEFSRKFCVRSKDKKFAYDVCNAKMIDYLLGNTDMNIEIERNTMALTCRRKLKAAEIEYNMARLTQVRSMMPEYLFRN